MRRKRKREKESILSKEEDVDTYWKIIFLEFKYVVPSVMPTTTLDNRSARDFLEVTERSKKLRSDDHRSSLDANVSANFGMMVKNEPCPSKT